MTLLRTLLLPLAALSTTAAALRITNVRPSGPQCPTDTEVTWDGNLGALVFHLDDFNADLSAKGQTHCTLEITFEDGRPGSALVVDRLALSGRLGLSAGAEVRFMPFVHWIKDQNYEQISNEVSTSSARRYSNDVSLSSNFGSEAASPCIGEDGDVGKLNVNLRLMAVEGDVTFGAERDGSSPAGTLALSWAKC